MRSSAPLVVLAALVTGEARAATVTVDSSGYNTWVTLGIQADFSASTATGAMGAADWYDEELVFTSTGAGLTLDEGVEAVVYDGYDAATSVYDATDAFSVGTARAGAEVVGGWASDLRSGQVTVSMDVYGQFDTSWFDYDAALAVGELYPAYPPIPAYRVAAPVSLQTQGEAVYTTKFTIDAPATMTLSWPLADDAFYAISSTDFTTSFGGWMAPYGPTSFDLPAGQYVLTTGTFLDDAHADPTGAGTHTRVAGVELSWTLTFAADADADGVPDADDNCPTTANAGQADVDADLAGDACDPCPNDALDDIDGDGFCGDIDVCPSGDDALDSDADLTPDDCDACPADADNDADGDGICADADTCLAGDDTLDADGDLTPDACDACPDDAVNDVDGDGICGDVDNCAGVANANQSDLDLDGVGDACEPDTDGDAVWDDVDNCVATANPSQADTDLDGIGNACELDSDDDGVNDDADACPDTDPGDVVDAVGCALDQLVPCDGAWKNHGAYVSALTKEASRFVTLGLITAAERSAIVSAGAKSTCGK